MTFLIKFYLFIYLSKLNLKNLILIEIILLFIDKDRIFRIWLNKSIEKRAEIRKILSN